MGGFALILVAPLSVIANIMAGRPLTDNIALLNADWLSVFGLQWDAWPAMVPLWFLRALFILDEWESEREAILGDKAAIWN